MERPNRWMEGLHRYNKHSDEWCIPRKGSDRYNEIMGRIKSNASDSRRGRVVAVKHPRIHRSNSPRHPHGANGGRRHRSNSPRHKMYTTYHKVERKARKPVLPSAPKNPLVYDKVTGVYVKALSGDGNVIKKKLQ